MIKQGVSVETDLIHAGEPSPRIEGALVAPIFQSSTFLGATFDDTRYIRFGNTPSQSYLQDKLAALEGAEAALVLASGMAAISTAAFTLLKAGDHIIAHRSLYGATYLFFQNMLPRSGISVDFVDLADPQLNLEAIARKETSLVYAEAMSSPALDIPDFERIVAFCRRRGVPSMIDNTFATPVNFRPIEIGFDIVMHSATKYLNGHGDIVAGVLAGRRAFIDASRQTLMNLGGSLDPHAAFLLHRGLKTLAARMRIHNASALQLAALLERHPAVSYVNYPHLPTSRNHGRAMRYFPKGSGGLLSFEIKGGGAAASRFVEALTIPALAASLGGVETLIMIPARLSHAKLTPEERLGMGVTDGLIRVAVGLEGVEDLIADFEQAFANAA